MTFTACKINRKLTAYRFTYNPLTPYHMRYIVSPFSFVSIELVIPIIYVYDTFPPIINYTLVNLGKKRIAMALVGILYANNFLVRPRSRINEWKVW